MAEERLQAGRLDERQVTSVGLNALKSKGIQGKNRGSTIKIITPVTVKGDCQRVLTCGRTVARAPVDRRPPPTATSRIWPSRAAVFPGPVNLKDLNKDFFFFQGTCFLLALKFPSKLIYNMFPFE